MIARSDLFILVVSASLLGAGILRWQSNMSELNIASNSNSAQQRQSSVASNATPTTAAQPTTATNSLTASSGATQVSAGVLNVSATTSTSQSDVAGSTLQNAPVTDAIAAASDTNNAGVPNEPLYGVYVVQAGDFLGKIAGAHGTSVATLREINNISGSLIEIGQEIKYPQPAN